MMQALMKMPEWLIVAGVLVGVYFWRRGKGGTPDGRSLVDPEVKQKVQQAAAATRGVNRASTAYRAWLLASLRPLYGSMLGTSPSAATLASVLKQFQADVRIPVTGIPDAATDKALVIGGASPPPQG